MSKTALVDRLAKVEGITKVEATERVKSVFSAISEELTESNMVRIQGFGSFNKSPLKRSSTLFGKKYDIDTNVVRFSAFKKLKTSVNG